MAEDWQWSSLWRREKGRAVQHTLPALLPAELPSQHLEWVNEILPEEQLSLLRNSVNKGAPYGTMEWVEQTIDLFNLEYTVQGPGRPRSK